MIGARKAVVGASVLAFAASLISVRVFSHSGADERELQQSHRRDLQEMQEAHESELQQVRAEWNRHVARLTQAHQRCTTHEGKLMNPSGISIDYSQIPLPNTVDLHCGFVPGSTDVAPAPQLKQIAEILKADLPPHTHSRFFSQMDEDRLLFANYFAKPTVLRGGTFLEIGAFDGTSFTNTLFFENSLDWSGVLIEPSPVNFAKCQAARGGNPKNKLINAAVCNTPGKVEFLEHAAVGAVVDPSDPILAKHNQNWNTGNPEAATIKVDCDKAATLLSRHAPEFTHFDLMSVDLEGLEATFLSTFPWGRVSTGVLIVEANDKPNVYSVLHKLGFVCHGRQRVNVVFVNETYLFTRASGL